MSSADIHPIKCPNGCDPSFLAFEKWAGTTEAITMCRYSTVLGSRYFIVLRCASCEARELMFANVPEKTYKRFITMLAESWGELKRMEEEFDKDADDGYRRLMEETP